MRKFLNGLMLLLAANSATAQEEPMFDLELLEEVEEEVRDAQRDWLRDRSPRRFSSLGEGREAARGYVRAFWDRYPETFQDAYPRREWAEWVLEEGRFSALAGHFGELLSEVEEAEILRVSAHRESVTVISFEKYGRDNTRICREEWIREDGDWKLSRKLPPDGEGPSFNGIRGPVFGEELFPGSEDHPTSALYFADLQESLYQLELEGPRPGQTTAQHQREQEELRERFDGFAISDVGYVLDVKIEHGRYVTVVDCGFAHLYVPGEADLSDSVGLRASVRGRTYLWRIPVSMQFSETPNIFLDDEVQVRGISWRVCVQGEVEVLGGE